MSGNKTQPTQVAPIDFLSTVEPKRRSQDGLVFAQQDEDQGTGNPR